MYIDDEVLTKSVHFIQEYTGLHSPESNHSHLRRVLIKMSREAGIAPLALLDRIQKIPELKEQFINQAMIGETYFFRESAHFHILSRHVLPKVFQKRGRITIWTGSCSTGEEAISLAALGLHYVSHDPLLKGNTYPQSGNFNPPLCVYATDLNTDSLNRLQTGRYPKSSLRGDGKEFHERIKPYIAKETEKEFQLQGDVLSVLKILPLNLNLDSLEVLPDDFDVVFFRNTLIYASHESRVRFLKKIIPKIKKEGYLFVASSEVPFISHPLLKTMEIDGTYIFQKGQLVDNDLVNGKPVSKKKSSTSESSILTANQQQSTDVEEYTHSLHTLITDFTAAMNSENREAAQEMLDELERYYPGSVYTPFVRGLYLRSFGDPKHAHNEFSRALYRNKDFWPAHYYLAEINRERDPEFARRRFALCLDKLTPPETPIHAEQADIILPILLDGFDVAYFRHLCSRWMDKLETAGVDSFENNTGERYAHR